MPSARRSAGIMGWLKGKIAAISVVVAAIAVFVGNVDTIVNTVGGWFGPKGEPPAQTIVVQITTETLLKAARDLEQASQAAQGSAKAEAAEAAKDLTQAAQALPQPVSLNEGADAQPPWLKIAMAEVGQEEVAGGEHNPRIVDYIRSAAPAMADQGDEVPWSSFFVNWVVTQAGLKGTNSGAGRSWLDWGVPLEQPRLGAIAVFSRGANPQAGHPGFFLSEAGDYILCVSGNIGNAVRIGAMPKDRLLGYRWPAS
jgi:uncharacterized protein (TIGR02594 family)